MTVVQRHDSLTGIPREHWDKLAASHTFFASWGWLRYLEGAPGPAVNYLTVAGEELLAGWPIVKLDRPANARYDLGALFSGLAGGAAALPSPYVVAGASRGYRATAMARDPAWMTPLMAASLAESAASGGLAMLYLGTADARLVAGALRELGRPATPILTAAEAAIPVHGESLAEHSAASRSRLRQRIRRETGLFESSGLRIVSGPFGAWIDRVIPLHYELLNRYEAGWDLGRTSRSLRRLAAAAPSEPTLLLAVDESDEPVGFSLSYPWGDALYVRVTGYRYERLRAACEYFMLTCYEPIRLAGRAGRSRVHLGLESLQAKLIRGAELEPLWSVIVPARQDIPDRDVRVLNRSRADALRRQYAAHATAFTGECWQAWQ